LHLRSIEFQKKRGWRLELKPCATLSGTAKKDKTNILLPWMMISVVTGLYQNSKAEDWAFGLMVSW